MKNIYRLDDDQINQAIKWKIKMEEDHICVSKNTNNYQIIFSAQEEYSIPAIICNGCNKSKWLFHEDESQKNSYINIENFSFDKPIFIGGPCSELQTDILHQRLNYALNHLSGEQQNGGMGSDYNQSESLEAQKQIDLVIEDIITALNAKNRFKKI